ncbi:MAG: DUF1990 domain-containing protein, partial [Actinomycetota bacterium]
ATAPRSLYGFRRPTPARLQALVDRESAGPLSYEDAGPAGSLAPAADPSGTAPPVPPGYHLLRLVRPIGHGAERFAEARSAIAQWAGHRRAGATVHPEGQAIEVGGEVAVALRVWPLWITATCRIVDVVDEADRYGFTYGTLAHHPEAGEESFSVIRDPATDEVRLEVVAVSRPTSPLARLGGPVGHLIQRFMAGRYLDGFEHPDPTTVAPPTSPTSIRWWFEDRRTGRLVVGQFPNWPLFAIGAATVVRRLSEAGGAVNDGASWLTSGLWLYWGGDELVRGVNPWRRLIGAGVVGWQIVRLLTR